jgi:uncharacterized protein (DUF433 family)
MNPDIIDRGRGPEIAGTRIAVFDVLDYLEAGWDDRGIAAALGVHADQVQAAREYIDVHSEAVRAEFRKIKERIVRGNPPEVRAKLAAARAKLRARMGRPVTDRCQRNGDAHR